MKTAKVEFDPSNREHRMAIFHLLKNGGWGAGGCKFKFKYNATQEIKEQLLKWYLENED